MPRWTLHAVLMWLPFAAVGLGAARLARWAGDRVGHGLARAVPTAVMAPGAEGVQDVEAAETTDQASRIPGERDPGEPELAAPSPGLAARARDRGPASAPVLHHLHVAAGAVLRAARAGIIPSGQPVAATPARPAGLALQGVGAFGVGLRDGDVLTDVAGVAASSPDVVVGVVLAARKKRAPSLTGRVWRGDEPWQLVVDLPYPG